MDRHDKSRLGDFENIEKAYRDFLENRETVEKENIRLKLHKK